jgi:hypothetical protein
MLDREIQEVPYSPTPKPDYLVVRTDALARAIEDWARHYPDPELQANDELGPTQAISYLMDCEPNRIYRILARKTKFTELRIADEILTIIGMQDRFGSDSQLYPVANPVYSQESWIAWKSQQGCV